MQLSFSNAEGTHLRLCRLILLKEQRLRRMIMDWRNEMIRVPPPAVTREEETAYAAGWTISGLATLGTIIAVWLFAI